MQDSFHRSHLRALSSRVSWSINKRQGLLPSHVGWLSPAAKQRAETRPESGPVAGNKHPPAPPTLHTKPSTLAPISLHLAPQTWDPALADTHTGTGPKSKTQREEQAHTYNLAFTEFARSESWQTLSCMTCDKMWLYDMFHSWFWPNSTQIKFFKSMLILSVIFLLDQNVLK